MRILGIETSCDETAVCLIEASGEFVRDFEFKVFGNAVLSQVKEHEKYGGVFPNIAKREHGRNLTPVLEEVLRQAKLLDAPPSVPEAEIVELKALLEREPDLYNYLAAFLRNTGKPPIDAIAVTVGPGLEPALWVGINFAKSLSQVWDVPIVPVNHMEGHIVLSMLGNQHVDLASRYKLQATSFPMLSLLISGGHTELVLSREWTKYEILGQTRDDAVGEAFDKVARLLGFPYPGGPQISRLAEGVRNYQGETLTISLPRPMIDSDNYDFSFAGLKTAVRRLVEANQPLTDDMRTAIAKEFEDAAADVLVTKTMRAIEEFNVKTVLVGGGVSANTHIRRQFAQALKDYGSSAKLLIPPPELSTDNALTIALAGYFQYAAGNVADPSTLVARGNLKLG